MRVFSEAFIVGAQVFCNSLALGGAVGCDGWMDSLCVTWEYDGQDAWTLNSESAIS